MLFSSANKHLFWYKPIGNVQKNYKRTRQNRTNLSFRFAFSRHELHFVPLFLWSWLIHVQEELHLLLGLLGFPVREDKNITITSMWLPGKHLCPWSHSCLMTLWLVKQNTGTGWRWCLAPMPCALLCFIAYYVINMELGMMQRTIATCKSGQNICSDKYKGN